MKKIYLFGFVLLLLVASTSAYYNMYSGDEFLEVVVNNNTVKDDFVYSDNIIYVNSSEYSSLETYSEDDKEYYKYQGNIFDEEKVIRCYNEAPEGKLFYIKCPN